MDQATPDQITRQNFYQRGQDYIERFGGKDRKAYVISPGSDAFNAWCEYFERHLRWTPVMMQEILDGRRNEMTVPAPYPQTFDGTFREDNNWRPAQPKRIASRITHETIEELRAKYGPNWGLKVQAYQKRAKREWTPPTDEDLLRMYGKRQAS